MYEKMSAGQQNGAILGNKLRRINGILAQARPNNDVEIFTSDELHHIERICANAKVRAQTVFEETKSRLDSKVSGGSPPVEREYNGK